MSRANRGKLTVVNAALSWWSEQRAQRGLISALAAGVGLVWEFVRDSMPYRRKRLYGDVDFDWDHRVDTTSATVNWRDRLLGLLHSPYQPTDPALFREMLEALKVDFRQFTFIDLGSGKGRVLLMASDHPFKRIVGVELLPALHRIASENIQKYKSESQQCKKIDSICRDAREFVFPTDPLVVYIFHSFSAPGLAAVMANLEQSLVKKKRAVYVIYHNPLLERVLAKSAVLKSVGRTEQYVIYQG